MTALWMVRARRGGENLDDFLGKSVVALGWSKVGKLPPSPSKVDLVARLARAYPDDAECSHATWVSTLLRFRTEFATGDTVITYDPESRCYRVGELTSDYEWDPQSVEDKPHVRQVTWTHQVSRDSLSPEARNSLGSIQTLSKLSDTFAAGLRRLKVPFSAKRPDAPPLPPDPPTADEDVDDAKSEAELRAEVLEKADAFVEDAISRLDWAQMQELVAGILRTARW